MYEESLAKHYDLIFSNKNYDKEVCFIKSLLPPNFKYSRVLDVGCGTGEHLKSFLNTTEISEFVGVDHSEHMIKVAKEKKELADIDFVAGDVSELNQSGFDLVTSMFNVVNHIETLEELNKFFKNIRKKIKKDHFFVFDSWNGIAAIRDAPLPSKKTLESKNLTIKIQHKPDVDYINSTVDMINNIDILDNTGYIIDNIEYKLKHILWTPKTLKDLLKMNNFKVEGLYKGAPYDQKQVAQYKDYKIIFLCKAV
tara:strand:- start:497 stop:1255 length:759 start_codon:yes stop_codon:yes gene_type:complete